MFVLLDAIDKACALLLPAAARVALYGLFAGVVSMLIYWGIAPQCRLVVLKKEISEAQRALRTYNGTDPRELLRLCKGAIGPAFKQAAFMIGPTLIAMAPVLLLVAWLEATFTSRLPNGGDLVAMQVSPAAAGERMRWDPPGAVAAGSAAGSYAVRWPGAGDTVAMSEGSDDRPFATLPLRRAVRTIERPRWWGAVLQGRDRVELPAGGAMEVVEMDLPERWVWSAGPRWLRSWYTPFTIALCVAALGMKFGFKIA